MVVRGEIAGGGDGRMLVRKFLRLRPHTKQLRRQKERILQIVARFPSLWGGHIVAKLYEKTLQKVRSIIQEFKKNKNLFELLNINMIYSKISNLFKILFKTAVSDAFVIES